MHAPAQTLPLPPPRPLPPALVVFIGYHGYAFPFRCPSPDAYRGRLAIRRSLPATDGNKSDVYLRIRVKFDVYVSND